MNTPLKKGWKLVKLGDVATEYIVRGNSANSEYDRFVGSNHIGRFDLRTLYWGGSDEVSSEMKVFQPGDYLFVRRSLYASDFRERAARADFAGLCSGDILTIREKEGVVADGFLAAVLNHPRIWEHVVATATGSITRRIKWKQLAEYKFSLPPLKEQSRIANLLFGIEDNLIELNKLFESLEDLRKSFIVEKFNKLLEGNSQIVTIAEAGEVVMGRQRSPQYEKGISPRPYLRVANIYDGVVDTTDVKTMDFSDTEFEKFGLKYGDVLLVEGHSSAEVVGRSAIYKDDIPGSCFQNTLLRFRPNTVSSEFAHQFFRYCLYTRKFSRVAKQTTIAHLGSTRFSSMKFPLVTKEVDREITDAVTEIETNISQVQNQIELIKKLKHQTLSTVMENAGK